MFSIDLDWSETLRDSLPWSFGTLLSDPRILFFLSFVHILTKYTRVPLALSGVSSILTWVYFLQSTPMDSLAPCLIAPFIPALLSLFFEQSPPVYSPSSEVLRESSGIMRAPPPEVKSPDRSQALGDSPVLEPSSKPLLSRRQRKNFRKKRQKASQECRSPSSSVVAEEETVNSATSSQYSSGSSDSGVCSGNNEAKAEEEEEKKEGEEEEEEIEESLLTGNYFVPMSYGGFRQCKQFIKLGLSESDIYFNLLNYLLTPDQLMRLSYPVDHESQAKKSKKISSDLNIAAKVFVPKSSSSGATDLKTCVRCLSTFSLKDYDTDLTRKKRKNVCRYHHGKVRVSKQFGHAYTCCGGPSDKLGCQAAPHHVWSDSSSVVSSRGYVKTRKSKSIPFGVYSLDCEMAFTTKGMELVKVTVISVDGSPVYESFVQPDSRIVDHNTRFSGVTAKDLDFNPTKTLKQVQSDLLRIISSDTILIGHALDNDFRALRLIHDKVVDTAVLFPHFYGIPYRRSLKSLAEIYLKRRIQTREMGHDPYEDALASVELILWKMRKDLDDGLSLFV